MRDVNATRAPVSETELFARMAQRERDPAAAKEALAEIWQRYASRADRWLRYSKYSRAVRDVQLRQEVLQDAFIDVYMSAPKFDGAEARDGEELQRLTVHWVCQRVEWRVLRYLRKRRAEHGQLLDLARDKQRATEHAKLSEQPPSVERDRMQRAIDRLPPRERSVLLRSCEFAEVAMKPDGTPDLVFNVPPAERASLCKDWGISKAVTLRKIRWRALQAVRAACAEPPQAAIA